MPVSNDHYDQVRAHFKALLGGECPYCGTIFNLEFHHLEPLKTKSGRGRDVRLWEWFEAYENNNLTLVCRQCHKELHGCDNNENNE